MKPFNSLSIAIFALCSLLAMSAQAALTQEQWSVLHEEIMKSEDISGFGFGVKDPEGAGCRLNTTTWSKFCLRRFSYQYIGMSELGPIYEMGIDLNIEGNPDNSALMADYVVISDIQLEPKSCQITFLGWSHVDWKKIYPNLNARFIIEAPISGMGYQMPEQIPYIKTTIGAIVADDRWNKLYDHSKNEPADPRFVASPISITGYASRGRNLVDAVLSAYRRAIIKAGICVPD